MANEMGNELETPFLGHEGSSNSVWVLEGRDGSQNTGVSNAGGIVSRTSDALSLANQALARDWAEALETCAPSLLWINLFHSSTDKGTSRERAAAKALNGIVKKAMDKTAVLLVAALHSLVWKLPEIDEIVQNPNLKTVFYR